MNSTDLPPLPSLTTPGPGVCDVVRLYLAVWDDLSDSQKNRLTRHIELCPDCAAEHRLMRRTTRQVSGLVTTTPSPHVDQAVLAAIAARSRGGVTASSVRIARRRPRRTTRRLVTEVAALAAVFMLALLGISQLLMQTLGGSAQTAFALPNSASWNGYVLYHTQTEVASNGKQMQVTSYRDLGNGNQHVETTIDGQMDVVVVTDKNEALGMDMMHNVAQWNAQEWTLDEPLFNLTTLRQDLASHKVTYIGTTTYNGQTVYQLRNTADGTVLLLNKNYVPVNVLEKAATPTAGTSMQPMYDTFLVLPASRVPADTWDMTIPKNFKMGKLPAMP